MYFLSGWVNLWLLGGGSQQRPRVPLGGAAANARAEIGARPG